MIVGDDVLLLRKGMAGVSFGGDVLLRGGGMVLLRVLDAETSSA